MALNPLSGAGPQNIAGAGAPSKVGGGAESFGKVMKGQPDPSKPGGETATLPVSQQAAHQAASPHAVAASQTRAAGQVARATPTQPVTAKSVAKAVDRVAEAQGRMDQVLKLAETGKSFSPAELLSLQAQVYRASQELDLAGKVVEKATGGVKQVLQTQV